MKKAGIVTIVDYVNYGNRLQNYATQEILKSFGFDVETIVNKPFPRLEEKGIKSLLKRIFNAFLLSPAVMLERLRLKIYNLRFRNKYKEGQKAKALSFKKYGTGLINETDFVVSKNNIPADLGNRYDLFFTGSDQIWNPAIRHGSSFDFLNFAPKEKRIALSPSFGVSVIPGQYKTDYKKWLSEMAHLSVREQAGADIIKELTGRDAVVLIDPTLMLTTDQWLKVSEKARFRPDGKYLLTYFIGTMSPARKKQIRKLASENNLELVQLANLEDFKRYDANPGEFIDYIANAELVCTDSFHAVIFSMQMKKPFLVFDREGKSSKMSSRLDTLLRKFRFEKRKSNLLSSREEIFTIDYSGFDDILGLEREKFNTYLKGVFSSVAQ
jgi:hypothetical protein